MVNTEILEITANAPVFQLTWSINNICTNHCRYCPATLHSGKNHHYEWAHAERFALALMDQHEHIQLAIAGGEPTVSPWLKDLINLFLSRGHQVGVTSNGVRAAQYWADCRPDYVCLSYHAEYADDKWIVRAMQVQQMIPHTTVRVMMDPDRWDQCLRAFNALVTGRMGVEAVRIVDWGGDSKQVHYSAAQLEWLDQTANKPPDPFDRAKVDYSATVHYLDGRKREYASGPWANRLISQNKHYFTGWQCDIGLNSLFVQYDGSYRRGNCSQGGYLGWLQDPVLKWPRESVICELDNCHCTTDILTPKRLIPIRQI